jgi:ribonucleoside-diphosphate reductase alpha chain
VAEQVVLDEDEFDELEEMSEPRPYVLPGWFYKQQTPFGNAFIGISEKRGQPYELFSYIGKAGSDTQAMAEAASRIASKWMRTSPLQDRRWVLSEVADQFDGIGGTMTSGFGPNKVRSIPDGVSKVIKHYLGNKFIEDQAEVWKAIDEQPEPDLTPHNPPFSATPTLSGELCPQCSSFTVHRMEGCKKCIACDYSEC